MNLRTTFQQFVVDSDQTNQDRAKQALMYVTTLQG